jgi:hypothetical protein
MTQPTAQAQELLELINRLRMNPAAELRRLIESQDPLVKFAFDYYQVNLQTLAKQWETLQAVAPLAWSDLLFDAANKHNLATIALDKQAHVLPGELEIGARLVEAGYQPTFYGENVYAASKSIEFTHVGLAVDWGRGANAIEGIQNPASHRNTLMSSLVREVGISAIEENDDNTLVGPLVVTEDFGNRAAIANQGWLLGVVFDDRNRDGFYQAGEGLNDVEIKITGIDGTSYQHKINVGSAGGYQQLLNPGEYQVDFLRNDRLVGTQTARIDRDRPENIKRDLILPVTRLGEDLQVSTIEGSLLDFRIDKTQSNLPMALASQIVNTEIVNVTSDASYQNHVGLYRIEDAYGTVQDPTSGKSYRPGDAEYTAAAIRRSLNPSDGIQFDRYLVSQTTKLNGGYIYAPLIIANGTADDVLNNSNLATKPEVYFNYHAANRDRQQHIRTLAPNTFGFEDTFGGGDNDFNDLVFQVKAKAQN